jgi:hypothetical protein
MTQKLSYVWILLVLATTACTTPQEQQGKSASVFPLAVTQRFDEENRRALTQPLALTQKEKLFMESFKVRGRPKVPALTPLEQQRLVDLAISLKSVLNGAKQDYKQALAEQEKQSDEWGFGIANLYDQQWFKSMTDDQKMHCGDYIRQQAQANLKQQNEILEAWGDYITSITRFMEVLDSDPGQSVIYKIR